MSLTSKIDLENLIFARAAQLHVLVYAKYGGLVCLAEDLELQTLIYVYNMQFRAENLNCFCSSQEALEQREAYLAQRPCLPKLTRVYQAKELSFELVLSEKK